MPDQSYSTPQEQQIEAREFTPKKSRLTELVGEFNHQVDKARLNTQGWRDRRVRMYERRKGMIGKDRPDVPFKGSSDIRFRLAEQQLRKINPSFVLGVLTAP